MAEVARRVCEDPEVVGVSSGEEILQTLLSTKNKNSKKNPGNF